MLDVNKFISTHTMVTSDNVISGMKVLVNNDGGEFNFVEGTIIDVVAGRKAKITIKYADGSESSRFVKAKDYYANNPLSIRRGPIPYIDGEHSNVYLQG